MYPSAILLTLYNTLVTPHLHYCLLCWGSIIKENDLLHIMQKRVLRTITNSNYIAHTITLPTRLSDNSSLIDNVFSSNLSNALSAYILNVHISDHQPVFLYTDDDLPHKKLKYITIKTNSKEAK